MGRKPTNMDATPRGEDDDAEGYGDEAEHPAEPATKPPAPAAMRTVEIGKEERLNLAIQMTGLMEDVKLKEEEASRVRKQIKELKETIDRYSTYIRTGTKEIPADQGDLFHPDAGKAPAQALQDLADEVEGDGEDDSEAFEASAEELGKQSGRGKGRNNKAAA